jgi:hypothetical protein
LLPRSDEVSIGPSAPTSRSLSAPRGGAADGRLDGSELGLDDRSESLSEQELEMSAVGSLAFAVGVYLPLSSTSPIFIGGMVRWLSDLYVRKKHHGRALDEDQLIAETDKSPGVLLASGYIAGGTDPDPVTGLREERHYLRLLVAMVIALMLGGFVLGIVIAIATGNLSGNLV